MYYICLPIFPLLYSPVILAPFGLAGTLTGQVFKSVDTAAHRLLEDWRHFYPLHSPDSVDIPAVVEVLVGE